MLSIQKLATCSTRGEFQGMYYITFTWAMWIRQNLFWLWNTEETSPEIQNRGSNGPKIGHVNVSDKKKNERITCRFVKNDRVTCRFVKNDRVTCRFVKNDRVTCRFVKNDRVTCRFVKNDRVTCRFVKNDRVRCRFIKNNRMDLCTLSVSPTWCWFVVPMGTLFWCSLPHFMSDKLSKWWISHAIRTWWLETEKVKEGAIVVFLSHLNMV